MANDEPIIYLAIMTHGVIVGNYYSTTYEYVPQIIPIPPQFNYVAKITKNPRGSVGYTPVNYETGENKMKNGIIKDLTLLLAAENIEHNPPIVGTALLDKMHKLEHIKNDHYLTKTYNSRHYSSHLDRDFDRYQPSYTLNDTTTTSQYINKYFSKTITNILDKDADIYVLYQSGGPLHVGDQLLETIYNTYHSRLRRSNKGQIDVSLSDILSFLLRAGYYNVVLIDFSCETCVNSQNAELPTNTTHVRRARRALRGIMGGSRRNHRQKRQRRRHTRRY